jgi:glycosyltransferase involved in cell wall biosynthesis
MRIALIGPFGLHPKSTMRSRALGLARPLAARGHEVILIMPPFHTPEEADRTWIEDGVTLRYVPLDGGVLGTARRMVAETLAWQPDVVHSFKPKAYSGLVAWWLWQFHRRSMGLVTDSDDWEGWGGWNDVAPYSGTQKRFFAWQERWGLTHAHIVTVASRTLEARTLAMGLPEDRLVYLPNGPGIPPRFVSDGERAAARAALGLGDRPAVLLFSRLFEFDTARLVEVLSRVREQVPDMAVLFVGAGLFEDDSARFRAQLEAADLLGAVVDVGWTALEELPVTLAAGDVGLYLMDDTLLNWAKCPVKLADMLAAGVPVVGEAIGQVPEYIMDGVTGRLCASGDVAAVATALVALLQDPVGRQALGDAAAADIRRRFSWDELAEGLENVYRALRL